VRRRGVEYRHDREALPFFIEVVDVVRITVAKVEAVELGVVVDIEKFLVQRRGDRGVEYALGRDRVWRTRCPVRAERDRKFADSLLEGAGCEPSVPLVQTAPEWLAEMRAHREMRWRSHYPDNRMARREPTSCPNALPKRYAPRVGLVGRTLCGIAL
jgi:hypothetical protein